MGAPVRGGTLDVALGQICCEPPCSGGSWTRAWAYPRRLRPDTRCGWPPPQGCGPGTEPSEPGRPGVYGPGEASSSIKCFPEGGEAVRLRGSRTWSLVTTEASPNRMHTPERSLLDLFGGEEGETWRLLKIHRVNGQRRLDLMESRRANERGRWNMLEGRVQPGTDSPPGELMIPKTRGGEGSRGQ